MNRIILTLSLALPLLATSCAYNIPYRPASRPEQIEQRTAMLDIYPDDIRANPGQYANTVVAWAGIIRSTDAEDIGSNIVHAVTILDHHYFDWEEDRMVNWQKLLISPRGEGTFRTEWDLRKKTPDASVNDVLKFAAPGKLAIVYGVPQTNEDNVVVLKYRYLRIVDNIHFSTNEFDYGRFGEPFRYIGKLPEKK